MRTVSSLIEISSPNAVIKRGVAARTVVSTTPVS